MEFEMKPGVMILNTTCLLKVYFDFTYYLGLAPFRIVLGPNGVEKITSKFQQIFCGISTVFVSIRHVQRIRNAFSDYSKLSSDPVPYFVFATVAFSTLFNFLLIKRHWFHAEKVLAIVRCPSTAASVSRSTVVQRKYFAVCVLLAITLVALMALIAGAEIGYSMTEFDDWALGMVKLANHMFFRESMTTDTSDFGFVDAILVGFASVAVLQRYLFGHFADLYVLFHALTLWVSANHFSVMVSEARNKSSTSPQKTWAKLYMNYKAMRQLSSTINESLGSLVPLFVTEAIFFYSTHLDYTMRTDDLAGKLQLISFYISAVSIFIFSADIITKVEIIREWLAVDDNRMSVPHGEWQMVLMDLQANTIGVRGSNMSTITHGFVGTVFTLVVTYFVICLQQRAALSYN